MYLLYSKPGCMYCNYARELFELHEIYYEELKLGEDFNEMPPGAPSNWRTYPVIFLDDEFIGGFTELQAELEEDE